MKEKLPDSEQKILQAAKKIFARDGFSGARIDEIAKEAGINKAMIYYHFKSKEDLYNAVIDIFFQKEEISSITQDRNMSNRAKLREVIRVMMNKLSKDQHERCSMIAREMVSRGKTFQMVRDRYWIPDYKLIRNLLEDGVQKKEFSLSTPTDYTVFLIISMTIFYRISQVTYTGSEIYDSLYSQDFSMETYINYVLDKVLNQL